MRVKNSEVFKHQFDEDANRYNNIRFDSTVLDMMCRYMVSENSIIKRRGYSNIREFINALNPDDYRDEVRQSKLDFIRRALDARLNFNIADRKATLCHITGLGDQSANAYPELSNDEVIWIDTIIQKGLTFTYVYSRIPRMKNLISDLEHCDPTRRDEYAMGLINCMEGIIADHRQSIIEHEEEEYFSLVGDQRMRSVTDYYNTLTSRSNKLRTGIYALNDLLGGGFECGRVYSFCAVPSDGKSLTIVDLALQIKKYNADYISKDKTKIPTICILTMENACRETFERIFKMLNGPCDLSNYTIEQIMDILSNKGLVVNPENPINIVVKYKPNMSVSTSYYYDLYDELSMCGMEMICMIHDYTKRIKSQFNEFNADERLRLGAVVNEDKAFALAKQIPFITVAQFNREGIKVVEEARANGDFNIVAKLLRSHIGESTLIIENLDGAYAIAYEYSQMNGETRKWLGIKDLKSRGGSQVVDPNTPEKPVDTFYIPYLVNNNIKLQEDYGTGVRMELNTMYNPDENKMHMCAFDGEEKGYTINQYGKKVPKKLSKEMRDELAWQSELAYDKLKADENRRFRIEHGFATPEDFSMFSDEEIAQMHLTPPVEEESAVVINDAPVEEPHVSISIEEPVIPKCLNIMDMFRRVG